MHADGDARRALNLLELVVAAAPQPVGHPRVDLALVQQTLQRKTLRYDKAGEEHFNLISALHKSMRNSDPDAAVYWLARMLEAGEDPMYIARRLVRFASEDVGNADPQALVVAVAAKDAVHFIGMPEGNTALAQAALYLATAPKSNAVYAGVRRAPRDAAEHDVAEPVPLHLRNAPTRLMKALDYGKGYQYAHDEPDAVAAMDCLPERLQGRQFYTPTERGFEKEIKRRLDGWKDIKATAARRTSEPARSARTSSRARAARGGTSPAGRAGRRSSRRWPAVPRGCAHLLERQRIVRLHGGVAGHRRGDLLQRLFGDQAAVDAARDRRPAPAAPRSMSAAAQQRRHRRHPHAGAAEVLDLEAEAGQLRGARQQRRVAGARAGRGPSAPAGAGSRAPPWSAARGSARTARARARRAGR